MRRNLKEAEITRQIKDILNIPARTGRLWYFKVAGGPYQRPGIPDIVGCYEGRFFAIEVKRIGGRLTDKQKKELLRIERAGGVAMVAYDAAEVVKQLGLGYEVTPLFEQEGRNAK